MKMSQYAKDREWNIVIGRPDEIGKKCQLIHTATNAREPVLKSLEVENFCHVTCVGADTPGKKEIATKIVKRADYVVYDHADQVKVRGELQHSFQDLKNHSELGAFLQNPVSTDDFNLTIFDSTGCAAQVRATLCISNNATNFTFVKEMFEMSILYFALDAFLFILKTYNFISRML